jgi:hypothetical protein
LSVTTRPLWGATPVRVTVPVDFDPPETDVGDRLTERTWGGVMVRLALAVVVYVPEMVAEVVLDTTNVETVKVALVRPLAMVTLAGVTAAALLLCRVTTAPVEGATALRFAVPVAELPPTSEVGLRLMVASDTGSTVSRAVAVPLKDAVIVTGAEALTAYVVTVKVALVAFAGTVTEDGTEAAEVVPEETVTRAPPEGARPLRVTVATELLTPPTSSTGESESDPTPAGLMVREAEAEDVPKVAVTEAEV